MPEEEEAEFDLVMPIVLAASNGGPYDDAAVVAGMTCGALDQELKMAKVLNTLPHERHIDGPQREAGGSDRDAPRLRDAARGVG
jgi:hypothetical protein